MPENEETQHANPELNLFKTVARLRYGVTLAIYLGASLAVTSILLMPAGPWWFNWVVNMLVTAVALIWIWVGLGIYATTVLEEVRSGIDEIQTAYSDFMEAFQQSIESGTAMTFNLETELDVASCCIRSMIRRGPDFLAQTTPGLEVSDCDDCGKVIRLSGDGTWEYFP